MVRLMPEQTINDILETIAGMPLEDQIIITEVLQNRINEERRGQIANAVKESRIAYQKGTVGRGTVEDFLRDAEKDE